MEDQVEITCPHCGGHILFGVLTDKGIELPFEAEFNVVADDDPDFQDQDGEEKNG